MELLWEGQWFEDGNIVENEMHAVTGKFQKF
jgi:hypothetical protein